VPLNKEEDRTQSHVPLYIFPLSLSYTDTLEYLRPKQEVSDHC